MPSPDTRVLTTHVPVRLGARVDHIAGRLERSRGWVVKQALSAWVDQEEERHRLTLEGLADVEAGRTMDHAQVDRWPCCIGAIGRFLISLNLAIAPDLSIKLANAPLRHGFS
jgi:predicted transcriptional regulator